MTGKLLRLLCRKKIYHDRSEDTAIYKRSDGRTTEHEVCKYCGKPGKEIGTIELK